MRRRPALVLIATILLGWAPAEAATVAIARPLHPSPAVTEALFRLYGELLSAGLDVTIAELPAKGRLGPADARARLQEMAGERGVDAVIEIVGDATPVAVEIHVVGNATRRAEDARVDLEADTGNASGRLAIRALEVLRSSFVELDLGKRGRPGDPVAPPATIATPARAGPSDAAVASPGRLGLAAGAAALTSLDGVGTAVMPLLRVEWATTERLTLRATLAGIGTRPTVVTAAGTARIAEPYAVVGCGLGLGARPTVRPFVAISAGVLRTSIDGQAVLPRAGHTDVRWSFLAEGSLGTVVALGSRYYLELAAHAQLAAPYIVIHFDDAVVATAGRPNLLLTFALGARL